MRIADDNLVLLPATGGEMLQTVGIGRDIAHVFSLSGLKRGECSNRDERRITANVPAVTE